MKTIHLRISGLVQGVWFRQNTKEQALALGVTGWVRNLADGSVEITVTGNEEKLAAFVAWCHKGPGAAVVKNVEVSEVDIASFSSFEIRR